MIRLPPIKWAQRKDRVFLTIEVRDIKGEKVDLQPESLKFSGVSDGQTYEFNLNFFDEVSVEVMRIIFLWKESKWNIIGFAMQFILVKKDASKEYWKRLTKETVKFQHIQVLVFRINIQVDWIKYVDEDDEQEEGGKGLEDWDQNKFNDFQGGGRDEDDEDDGGDMGGDLDGGVDDLEKEEELPG